MATLAVAGYTAGQVSASGKLQLGLFDDPQVLGRPDQTFPLLTQLRVQVIRVTLHWGGSSAEILELQPGRTKLTAAPDTDQDVHTTAEGTFRVTEMTVNLIARGERYWCFACVVPLT